MFSDGLIRQLQVSVNPPSLNDTSSDWERLRGLLAPALEDHPLQASLASLQELGPALRRGAWQIAATLADVGDAWRLIRVESAHQALPPLGLAVDLGTTTVVAELVDVSSGKVLASSMTYNSQRSFGVDVTSRMIHAERPGGLDELRKAILDDLNDQIQRLAAQAQCDPKAIAAVTMAGNTIMMHLLLGFEPGSIRREPYVPTTTVFPVLTASEVGLGVHPSACLYLFPAASGYVGGDVTAGLLATNVPERDELSILIDIGTNGETVLGNRDFLLACSGSAGSAFEGCGLEWGMAAQPGAIEHVWIENGRVKYQTIANEPARGICGSGLIEALGALLQADVINRMGQVNLSSPCVRRGEVHPEVLLAPAAENAVGRDITLRQADLENLIRDKAALYAGSRILLANAELSFNDISEIMIAGNFGQSLAIEQAVRIGLLPDIPAERIRFIGNSSLTGARMALCSRQAWKRAGQIAASLTCLELTTEARYFEEYTAALFLPHTDLSLFPSLN